MDDTKKQEIINNLKTIASNIDEKELTMFRLVSEYNQNYDNKELIGGGWVRENIPEFSDLE